MRISRLFLLFLLVLPICSFAQSSTGANPGLQPYQSYDGSNIDKVNLSSGTASIQIPLISYPQRGNLKFSFSIYLNTRIATPQTICVVVSGDNDCHTEWVLSRVGDIAFGGLITNDQNVQEILTPWYYSPCSGCSDIGGYYASWVDADGAGHKGVVVSNGQRSNDASDYYTPLPDNTGASLSCTGDSCATINEDGIAYAGANTSSPPPPAMEDSNGNEITGGTPDTTTPYTDSVGRVIPMPPTASNSSDTSGCSGPLPISSVYLWQPPGVNGGTETFKVCYATVSISIPTIDDISGVTTTVQLPQSIVLPNQQTWTFEYQSSAPGDPSGTNFGDISQITLPNGGTISYTYARNSAWTCYGPVLCIASRSVNAADGQGAHTWNYTWGSTLSSSNTYTNTVTDPLGNDTAHSFPPAGSITAPEPAGLYEVKAVYYQGSTAQNNVLKTVNTTYIYQGSGAFPQTVTVTLNNGQTSEKALSYATVSTSDGSTYVNKITDQKDYDYGSGAPGSLLREIETSYIFQSNSAYNNANLISLIASSSTYNGSGTLMAQT